MKLKKIMLVALFLLAILTIGAVSATDDAMSENLTASETQDAMGVDMDDYVHADPEDDPDDDPEDDPWDDPEEDPEDDPWDDPEEDPEDDPEDYDSDYEISVSERYNIHNLNSELINIYFENYGEGGKVTIYLDGVKCKTYSVEYINRNAGLSAKNLGLTSLEYKDYNLTIVFSGDDEIEGFTKQFNFTGDYGFSVDIYDLEGDEEEEDNLPWGTDLEITVSLPDDANGNLTYEINGRKYSIPVEDTYGRTEITSDKLDIGENEIIFSYKDEKYPLDSFTYNINVYIPIRIDETEIAYNESAFIYLNMPADANGNLSIYEVTLEEDEDTCDYYVKSYTLIKSVPLENGFANITLSGLELGDHYIYANYTGNDYDVDLGELDYDSWWPKISVTPILKLPSKISEDEPGSITMILPEEYRGVFTLTIDGDDRSVNIKNGKGNIELFNIESADEYGLDVEVSFESDDYYYSAYLNIPFTTEYPEGELALRIDDKMLKGNEYFFVDLDNLPWDHSGTAIIFIDGEFFDSFDLDYGSIDLNLSSLDFGRHTLEVEYLGDGTDEPIIMNATFDVVDIIITISDKVYIGNYSDYIANDEIAFVNSIYEDGYYTLTVDGKVVDVGFPYKSKYINTNMDLSEKNSKQIDLSLGSHDVILTYTRGEIVKSLNKTINVVYGISESVYSSTDDYRCYDGENVTLSFEAPTDVNGNLIVTVDNTPYTIPIVNGTAKLIIDNLNAGEYDYTVRYDGEYPIINGEGSFTVEKREYGIWSNYNENYNTGIKYGDALIIYTYLEDSFVGKLSVYETIDGINQPIKTVNLAGGRQNITLSNLKYGSHDIHAEIFDYNDELYDWFEDSISITVDVLPVINGEAQIIHEYTRFGITESKTVNIELPSDANEILYVYKVNPDNEKEVIETYDFNVVDGHSTVLLNNFTLGENKYYFLFNASGYFLYENLVNIDVDPLVEYPKEINMGDEEYITVYAPKGNVTVFGISATIVNGTCKIPLSSLTIDRNIIDLVLKSDNYQYNMYTPWGVEPKYIEVYKPKPSFSISETSNPLTIELNKDATGDIIIEVGNQSYAKPLVNGKATINDLNVASNEDILLWYVGNDQYGQFRKYVKLGYVYVSNLTKQDTYTVVSTSTANLYLGDSISLSASIYRQNYQALAGTVHFYVNNKLVSIGEDGSYIPKEVGLYTVEARYNGTSMYYPSSGAATFIVLPAIPQTMTSNDNGFVEIMLPINATGILTVYVDEVPVSEIDVRDALARFKEETQGDVSKIIMGILRIDLSKYKGQHTIVFVYSGDDTYDGFRKESVVNVKISSISAGNMNALYTSGSKYTIKVFSDTDVSANGASVVVKVNGKTFKTLQTVNGVASFQVTQVPGTYKLTITSLGKTITKTLTVKHLVTLKTVKVKKSAKKLVLQATLAKVNGKYLKNKKITFKFKGKKYTAKTNKKGVAKVIIKANVLKKLKVGKKVTYQATYLKDTVKKTVKVKK